MSISIINASPGDRGAISRAIINEIRSNANYVEGREPKKYDEVIRHVNGSIREALRYLRDGEYGVAELQDTLLTYIRTCSLDPLSNGIALFIVKQIEQGHDPLKIFGMDKNILIPKRIRDAVLLSRPLPTNTVEEILDEII